MSNEQYYLDLLLSEEEQLREHSDIDPCHGYQIINPEI